MSRFLPSKKSPAAAAAKKGASGAGAPATGDSFASRHDALFQGKPAAAAAAAGAGLGAPAAGAAAQQAQKNEKNSAVREI